MADLQSEARAVPKTKRDEVRRILERSIPFSDPYLRLSISDVEFLLELLSAFDRLEREVQLSASRMVEYRELYETSFHERQRLGVALDKALSEIESLHNAIREIDPHVAEQMDTGN